VRDAPTIAGPLFLPDYHTHSARCGHAQGAPVEYVAAARRCGLAAIGISDHLPMLHAPDPLVSMAVDQLGEYVAEVRLLQREAPDFVLLGIEADYHPRTVAAVADLLAAHPFDYVIGSVHFLGEWGFDDPRNAEGWAQRDVDDVYLEYLAVVGDAAETGLFTILGHLDLVKKFGHRPSRPLGAALETLAERLARAGVVVELNTSGLRKPVGEIYPSVEWLRVLRAHDVPITFGSDAHRPADVGLDRTAAVEAARAAGYADYAWLTPGDGSGAHTRARAEIRPLP
jgi:histidinol-phosphatase (PHP family)